MLKNDIEIREYAFIGCRNLKEIRVVGKGSKIHCGAFRDYKARQRVRVVDEMGSINNKNLMHYI